MSQSKQKRWISTLLVAVLLLVVYVTIRGRGEDAPASDTSDASSSDDTGQRVQDDTQPPRIKAANVVALRQHVGQEVIVFGKVESTSTSRNSGIQFLNLSNSELAIVCTREQSKKFTAGAPAELFKNQWIEVTGELKLYRGKVQLPLDGPASIRILKDGEIGEDAPGFALTSIGQNKWQSPAGLIYQGRDPQGLTRKEHIMRHARDVPDRDGPHGVFAGGGDEAKVFALIDEAWRLAQRRGTRPQVEGERSTLLVSLGRKVGYLGGSKGRSQGNPPLERIFIVYETGTKNVVTAFPR